MNPSNRTYRLLSVLLSLSLFGAAVLPAAAHLRCVAADGSAMPCCAHHGAAQEPASGIASPCGHASAAQAPADLTFADAGACLAQQLASFEQAPAYVAERPAPIHPTLAAWLPVHPAAPTPVPSAPEPEASVPYTFPPPLDRPVVYASLLI